MILLSLLLALQTDKLPPANPVPYDDADTAAVMRPINAMFAGLAARNPAAILAQVRPDGAATVADEKPDGTRSIRRMTWAQFAAGIRPGPERYEERITDVAVEIDGDIAMVWGPYVFMTDGKPHHCGVDHFDLLRENGAWKVQNVTWSSRTTGCSTPAIRP